MQRLIKILKTSLFLLYGLYLVAANTLLNCPPLFNKILDNQPLETTVLVENGFTLIPGIIWIHNFRVHIRDQNVNFAILLKNGLVLLNLIQLPHKTLDLVKVWGQGVSGELVTNDNPPPVTKGPLKETWLIKVKSIHLSQLETIKLFSLPFKGGDSTIDGPFEIQPTRHAEIGPVDFKLVNASLEDLASPINGLVHLHVTRFEAPKVSGSQVYRYFSGEVNLNTHLNGLEKLNSISKSVRFSKGQGDLSLKILFTDGILLDHSQANLNSIEIRTDISDLNFVGQGVLHWEVAQRISQASLVLNNALGFHTSTHTRLLSTTKLRGLIKSKDLDLAKGIKNQWIEVSLEGIKIKSLKAWNEFFKYPLLKLTGTGKGKISLTAFTGHPLLKKEGLIDLRLKVDRVHAEDLGIQGDIEVYSELSPINLNTSILKTSSFKISGKEVLFFFPKKTIYSYTSHWQMDLDFQDFKLDFSKKLSLQTSLKGKFSDSLPFIEYLRMKGDVPEIARVALYTTDLTLQSNLSYKKNILQAEDMALSLGVGRSAKGKLAYHLLPKGKTDLQAKIIITFLLVKVGYTIEHGQADAKIFPGSSFLK